MSEVTIIEMSLPEAMTASAIAAIKGERPVYAQSAVHPLAKVIESYGVTPVYLDCLYEEAEDFDALTAAIAKKLSEQDCVYCASGSIKDLLTTLEKLSADVSVIPGIPLGKTAFPKASSPELYYATELPRHPVLTNDLIIEEIDNTILAGEVKLWLTEYYPDEKTVILARLNAKLKYQYKEIPLYELDRQKHFDSSSVLLVPALGPKEQTRYGFDDLMDILTVLRSPEGCPWDRTQTHESLRTCMIEEAYEASDAMHTGNMENLSEELGDVLMQVGLNTLIAEEHGEFNIRDVLTGVVQKLIYRHPHVFEQPGGAANEDEALQSWNSRKKAEKNITCGTDALRAVPESFPALMRAKKVLKRAEEAGYPLHSVMADPETAGEKLLFLTEEIRKQGTDPEQALQESVDAFIDRFEQAEHSGPDRDR